MARVKKKLYWLNPVDLNTGLEPSAYGLKLIKDEDDGFYYTYTTADRAKVELSRDAKKVFVDELVTIQNDDDDDVDEETETEEKE